MKQTNNWKFSDLGQMCFILLQQKHGQMKGFLEELPPEGKVYLECNLNFFSKLPSLSSTFFPPTGINLYQLNGVFGLSEKTLGVICDRLRHSIQGELAKLRTTVASC